MTSKGNKILKQGAKIEKTSEENRTKVEENLFVLRHDHAYSTRSATGKLIKDEDNGVEKNEKILTPSSISTLTIQQKKTGRKTIRKKVNENPKSNPKQTITDYFPVRRSERKTKTKLVIEKRKDFEEAVLTQREDGLKIENFTNKGRGVRATKSFSQGDFVVEYSGELIDLQEAKRREKIYSTDENTGCYMYYFALNDKNYCVDATAETKRIGRLINHSRNGNLVTKPFMVNDVPHLILVAKRDIVAGEELLYDYGDRNKNSLLVYPWLAT